MRGTYPQMRTVEVIASYPGRKVYLADYGTSSIVPL